MSELARDYLTGALTRQGLYEWYDRQEGNIVLQFMFMDLDNFKSVNDTYGHNIGDELLKAVARILAECMPEAVCARLGGDEFVVVVVGREDRESMTCAAQNIIANIRKKDGFQYISTNISASIGILLDEIKDKPLNEILFKIDTAMYAAKNHGKSCFIVFNDIAQAVYDEVDMEQRQVEALQKGEFEVCYKPVISAQTSKLFISEACLVWNEPSGRKRSQKEFLPLFEKNGFIRSLNLWQFESVCRQMDWYHKNKEAEGRIAIRISKLLLQEQELPELLISIMGIYHVKAQELFLEIEESVFYRGIEVILPMFEKLKAKGFGIIIGEVGSSFLSMKYWDKLPIDCIKFNAEYLQESMITTRGRQIIKALLYIEHDLKIKVIADGISKKEDVHFLCDYGCNAIGGPYYTEPLTGMEYMEYIKSKIVHGEQKIEFPFKKDFCSADGKFEGEASGSGVKLRKGISSAWGSVFFSGGEVMENVLELPASVVAERSYTIGMWLKPKSINSWSSAVYARQVGGFTSFVPFVVGGNSVYRISEDSDIRGFHDILSRSMQEGKWYFVCITYDEEQRIARYYINGRKAGYLGEVPFLPACKQVIIGGDPFQKSFHGYISALTFMDNAKADEEIEEWYRSFLSEKGYAGEKEEFWLEE